ncbi:MAG: glycosyltransferase [Sphingomicrobium sp.]
MTPVDTAAVVIGRNEGERLESSLRSVQRAGLPLVYVDSGSVDRSPDIASKLGVPLLELSPNRPFSAARARNEGLDEVLRRWPGTRYVLFLDGDCVLQAGFATAAAATFQEDAECAIVTGHLSERHPDASIYNRLCAIEWRSPAGRIENFGALGGIMMARVSALNSVGGFNEQVIAGEDSELGARLVLAGRSIIKIDQPMATHDVEMKTFRQWWTRAVRAGHSIAQRYALNGRSSLRDCRREFFSTLAWGLALPAAALVFAWPTHGLSLLLIGAYGILVWRVYRHYLRIGLQRSDAILGAQFIVYAKFANLLGVVRYWLNSWRRQIRIIEYK